MCCKHAAGARVGRNAGVRAGFTVVVIVACLVTLDTVPAFSEPGLDVRQVVATGDSTWTVYWQARTSERGGQFRLYSGSDLDHLQVVDTQRAAAGLGGYRFRDASGGAPWRFYQLRYVTTAGRELVLASMRVRPVKMRPSPVSTGEQPGPAAKALAEAGPPLSLTSSRREPLADVRLADLQRPEPEVPPPRALA